MSLYYVGKYDGVLAEDNGTAAGAVWVLNDAVYGCWIVMEKDRLVF